MNVCIFLAPSVADQHRHHATTASEDDMNGHRDVAAEGVVVQHVDGEEHGDVGYPFE